MNPVKELEKHGQAVWLDFLARGFIAKGDLKRLIDTDGVKGVTSNPSIFEKAIGSSDEYDAPIGKALKRGDRTVADLFEAVAIEDIQNAADVLRPVYDRLKGGDGYVSLEVSPYLAMDTAGTVAEARRLWKDVDRKNLMVKVPATPEGLPAIETLIGDGISINITLLFARDVYLQVAEAYLAGLEKYVAGGGDPSHVASVASFFVSRIDSVVDKQLDEKIARANDPSEKERLAALKGKVAIANAKVAYQDYKRLFSGPRWDKLAAKGAKPQRMLWASTGTKNKDYSDVLYVEELIGPDTINTVPPATLDAFRDHGKPRDSLEENVDDARRVLEELERSGVSLEAITKELVKDGVKQFADAADKLYGAVAHKRATVLGPAIDYQLLSLGDGLGKAVAKSTEEWRASAKIRRLWQHDKSVWTGTDEDKWLGWLDSAAKADVADYEDYASRVKGQKSLRCRRARHGRIEPWPRGAGRDFCAEVRLPEIARAGFHRSGTGPGNGGQDRHRQHRVHRIQQIRRDDRAERDEGLFPRTRRTGGRAESEDRPSLHRGDRSRLVAGEGGEEPRLRPHLPWRTLDRRPLFGALAVRPGAGRNRGHRRQDADQTRALHGPLLRTRRAAR
ncbi:transaldolase [Bradyrhizobium japonicum]